MDAFGRKLTLFPLVCMVSWWFMPAVTSLSMGSKTASMLVGWDEVNKALKYCSTTYAIPSSVAHHSSLALKVPAMWFFRLSWLAHWWKNLVFLSPAGSQMDHDRCLHATSSWCSNEFISARKAQMASLFFALFWLASSSKIFCLSWSLSLAFPKVVLLHGTKAYLGLP